jgi:DNA repair protein RecN (Recombination protein N)
MLTELHITNFAIIDRVDLSFSPGFNVLTGETGAGKSIIIDAVDMLLGGKAGQEVIRAGESVTEVEGVFAVTPQVGDMVAPILEREGLEGDDPGVLVLSRELRRGGRAVARVNGRAVALSVLREIGDLVIDIHGQTDHLSLMRQREHVNLLDRYAGLLPQRARVAVEARRLAAVRKELASLRQDQRELARRLDLLTFQVEEIDSAALEPGEDEALESERRRLANAEQLIRLTDSARLVLDEADDEQASAMDQLSEAAGKLAKLATIDPDTAGLLEAAEALTDQLTDLIRSIEAYAEEVEFNPERLAEVDERLALIFSLKRKYGDSIVEILAFGERARTELNELNNAEVRTAELEAEEAKLLQRLGTLGAALSKERRTAAASMAREVVRELSDLRMERAHFDVEFQWQAEADGAPVAKEEAPDGVRLGRYAFDSTGLDRVEFLVSANPGEPLKPLVKVASGGETSRLMLALKTVLGRADRTPTLIFDEIDVGIGGRVGATVGRKLWELTAGRLGKMASDPADPGPGRQGPGEADVMHQVLCITHLPQLAGYGDMHFVVRKQIAEQRTRTEVISLSGDDRVGELAAMLGSTSEAGRVSAEEMLAEVAAVKAQA